MSDSLERTRSDAEMRQPEGGNGAQHDVPDGSEAGVVAPEGVIVNPTLAGLQDKKANTVALKKRAPVPGRARIAGASANEVAASQAIIDEAVAPVPVVVEPEPIAVEIMPETAVAELEVVEAPVVVDMPISANGHDVLVEESTELAAVAVPSDEVNGAATTPDVTPKPGLWAT
ncbi:MAG: hypothetical protein ABIQ44_16075, partial [Chloroflexia bacterium]